MTHLELMFFKLYPDALRVTVTDEMLGTYEYLARDKDMAKDLINHLSEQYGKYGIIRAMQLSEEV